MSNANLLEAFPLIPSMKALFNRQVSLSNGSGSGTHLFGT